MKHSFMRIAGGLAPKLTFGAFALSAMLAACGDDSTSAKDADQPDVVVETFDDLPVCSDNQDGSTAYVKDEKTAYVCVDGDWVPEEENSSSSIASSSSSPRNDSLSSSVITSSSSEAPQSSSSETMQSSSSEAPQSSSSETTQSSSSADVNSSSSENELSSSSEMGIIYGTMTDSRDGKTYKTVKIGEQVWMAENLNYADSVMTPSLNGRSWCYDNNADSCAKYGRLYTWAAAIDSVALQNQDDNLICGYGRFCKSLLKKQGLCPDSWHLPDTTEWKMLFEAVGGQGVAGRALKTQSNWSDNSRGTNSYGFSALPSGYYREYDGFSYVNHLSNFWTATEGTSYTSYYISLESVGDAANRYDISKGNAFSVRCLKD